MSVTPAHTELSRVEDYLKKHVSPLIHEFIHELGMGVGPHLRIADLWALGSRIHPSKLGYWAYISELSHFQATLDYKSNSLIDNALHKYVSAPTQDNIDFIDWAAACYGYIALEKSGQGLEGLRHQNWALRNFFAIRKVTGAFLKYHIMNNQDAKKFFATRIRLFKKTTNIESNAKMLRQVSGTDLIAAVTPVENYKNSGVFHDIIAPVDLHSELTKLNITHCKGNQQIQEFIYAIEQFNENDTRNLRRPERPQLILSFLTAIEIAYSEM